MRRVSRQGATGNSIADSRSSKAEFSQPPSPPASTIPPQFIGIGPCPTAAGSEAASAALGRALVDTRGVTWRGREVDPQCFVGQLCCQVDTGVNPKLLFCCK